MVENFKNQMKYCLELFRREMELSSQHNLLQGNYVNTSLDKLMGTIIHLAKSLKASDIHLEPGENKGILRLRVDGILHTYYELPGEIHPYLISYLKIQGKMDISEKRLPQDGALVLDKEELDLRLSIIPTMEGEKAVMRLLAKGKNLWTLEQVGFAPEDLVRYKHLLQRSSGLVVITGPVNSGKSTLLYATLDYLNKGETNLITIEDPVEIKMPGINQMQVNQKAGLTYGVGLRAMLRQDPDVIMIGEIRDEQVAQEALRGALTGHLVLTTLHTKNALGVISRLLNMGVDKSMLALALQGATAQRLIRRLCPYCMEEVNAKEYDNYLYQPLLAGYKGKFYRGKGCEACHHTGYWGRIPLYEILTMDNILEQRILQGDLNFSEEIKQQLNYSSLKVDGWGKINQGLTTVEEVWRALNGIEFSL